MTGNDVCMYVYQPLTAHTNGKKDISKACAYKGQRSLNNGLISYEFQCLCMSKAATNCTQYSVMVSDARTYVQSTYQPASICEIQVIV